MKSLYRSASFAALVVTSSLALLTGAQAETISFGTACCSVRFNSTGTPGSGTMTMFTSSLFSGPAGNNGGGNNTSATFDGLTGGSFRLLGPGNPGIPGPTFTLGGYDPTTQTFTQVQQPNTSTFTVSFNNGADSLAGNIDVTSVQDNLAGTTSAAAGGRVTLFGDFTETSGSGALGAAFGAVGGKGIFELPMGFSGGASPPPSTLIALFALPAGQNTSWLSGSPSAFTPSGSITPVPLPPAIYLFGSVVAGAFWLGRRKLSAD